MMAAQLAPQPGSIRVQRRTLGAVNMQASARPAVVRLLRAPQGFRTAGKPANRRSCTPMRAVILAAAEGAPAEAPVAVVTGASQGIGKCIALELAKAGCRLVINYRNEDNKPDAEAVAQEIKELGSDAIIVPADMAKLPEIEAMYKLVVEQWGTVDILVNNAGITRDTLIMKMKPEQWQEVIDINLTAVFYNMQAALKVMSKKRKGRIVNIASVVGIVGNPGQVNYSAAKGGVITMTKTVAREYAARSIVANCVAPGFIQTAMTAKIDPKYNEKILEGIPLGRMGKPEEVAGLVRYLATDPSAAYITGQCLPIDGGMVM